MRGKPSRPSFHGRMGTEELLFSPSLNGDAGYGGAFCIGPPGGSGQQRLARTGTKVSLSRCPVMNGLGPSGHCTGYGGNGRRGRSNGGVRRNGFYSSASRRAGHATGPTTARRLFTVSLRQFRCMFPLSKISRARSLSRHACHRSPRPDVSVELRTRMPRSTSLSHGHRQGSPASVHESRHTGLGEKFPRLAFL